MTEHLGELRRRLIVAALALAIAFAGMYAVHDALIDLLTRPLPADAGRLVTLSPTEPLLTTLKVSFWAAVLLALPVWLYQLYAFAVPAVGDQRRRVALAVVAAVSALFAAGVAFGYLVVLPVALEFLVGFGGDAFDPQLRAGDYLGFATTMLLASGLMFEVPAAMTALSLMGVTSARMYRSGWRVALVAIAAVAAVLPGGDPVSMALLMVPQVALYAVGVALSARFGREPAWRAG
ncbi:twin-arginine translocase subunit TatC [Miltoncostaea marina]|uniref:twin-arginine translocase subunit TatC n=1 Tax=Miltoncostaea marina TaxID=2843215 RepID=UPI001C3E7F31|nr:twin-arginine translocase subunit TatC [Miltoncostaea marina]